MPESRLLARFSDRWLRVSVTVLHGGEVISGLAMAAVGPAGARFPWVIVAMFCAGSLIDTLRRPPRSS